MLSRAFVLKFFCLVAVAGLFGYADLHFDFDENAVNLLPDGEHQREIALLKGIGAFNRIYITLEGDDEEALRKATIDVGSALEKIPFFRRVVFKMSGFDSPHFRLFISKAFSALMDENDMETIKQRISEQGIREALRQDFLLLNSPGGYGVEYLIRYDPLNFLSILLEKLQASGSGLNFSIRDGLFFSKDGDATLIWCETKFPLTDSAHAQNAESLLRMIFIKYLPPNVHPIVTGPAMHTLSNARAVQRDLSVLLPFASILLIFILFIFIRSFKGLLLFCIPMLSAPAAIFFTAFFSGWRIDTVALGFGIVLMGIAVDYAVHIYFAAADGGRRGVAGIRKALFLSYITTAGVFAVLFFSSVPVYKQMAILAFSGITVSLMISLWLVPELMPERVSVTVLDRNEAGCSGHMRISWYILCIWLAVIAWGLYLLGHLEYRGGMDQFDYLEPAATADEEAFKERWGIDRAYEMIIVNLRDEDRALDTNDRVYAMLHSSGIEGIRSISPILPGPDLQSRNIRRWNRFWTEEFPRFKQKVMSIGNSLGFSQDAFLPAFSWLSAEGRPVSLRDFERSPLYNIFSGLLRKDAAGAVDSLTVITLVREGFLTGHIENALRRLDGVSVVSKSIWNRRVNVRLWNELVRFGFLAGLSITVLLLLVMRNPITLLGVMAPPLSALAAIGLYSYFSGHGLNLMHTLIGLMVIGLAADYGIFMQLSKRQDSLKKAVLLCAFSTLSGFGVLSFAVHPALRSIGVIVLAGIGAALPAAIFISPQFCTKDFLFVRRS